MHREGFDRARAGLVLAVLLGAALRLYPIRRPYWHLELQEHYARNAVVAIARHDWRPFIIHNGAALFDSLRLVFTGWYAVGRALGAYRDRLDLLADFIGDPFPFIVVGRLAIWCYAVIVLHLVGRLGARLAGPGAGVAAAVLSAVTFVDVRAAHHVWPDVPAAAATLATVLAAERMLDRPSTGRLVLAGALAGVAMAFRLNAALAMLAVVVAYVGRRNAHLGRAPVLCLTATVVTYALLSPYSFLAYREALSNVAMESLKLVGPRGLSLPLGTLVPVAMGWGMPALALVGALAALQRARGPALVALVFPVAFLIALASSSILYARYLVLVTPFVAVFAGCGAVTASAWFGRAPRIVGAALVLLAASGPAIHSVQLDRLLAREDTRRLAGLWILQHVPSGTRLTLPNIVRYPNPMLPRNGDDIGREYPEWAARLAERGVGSPARTYPASYLGFFDTPAPAWAPNDRFIVTAYHPVVLSGMNPPPAYIEKLRAAGASPVAEFEGVREPLPPGTIYDPPDADYVPLAGFGAVTRPGPNIVIWELPPR